MSGDRMSEDRATAEDILAKVELTSYGDLLHDDQRRRHELYKMMADSADPMLREMGEQLRDGLLTPRQLLSVPEYWETLRRGYDSLEAVDLDAIADQIDEVYEREHDDHRSSPG
jgi:hypothetical protein